MARYRNNTTVNLRSGIPSFFSGREGTPDTITWLFVCCFSRIWTFLWLVKKQRVLRTKPWLITYVAVWLLVKEIPRADGVWRGERRERDFVSFKCLSWCPSKTKAFSPTQRLNFAKKLIFSRAEHLIAYNHCTQELITANNKHRSTAILCITVKLASENW